MLSQIEPYRVLATGSRDTRDASQVNWVMGGYLEKYGARLVVAAGGAPGIDSLVREWAFRHKVPFQEYKVNTRVDGPWPHAGPKRNRRMHDHFKPHEVVAFPGGRGTTSMVSIARRFRTPVTEIV